MLVFIVALVLPAVVCANTDESINSDFSWGHFGLGGIVIENSQGDHGIGLAMMINYTRKSQRYAYSLRALSGAAIFRPDAVFEFGFLFNKFIEYEHGGLLHGNKGLISLGIGAGVVTGTKRGKYIGPPDLDNAASPSDYESTSFTTLGVPIEIQILLIPPVFDFGLDLIGYANINSVQSFWGICLCPRIGKAM